MEALTFIISRKSSKVKVKGQGRQVENVISKVSDGLVFVHSVMTIRHAIMSQCHVTSRHYFTPTCDVTPWCLLAKTLTKRARRGRGVNAQAFSLLDSFTKAAKKWHPDNITFVSEIVIPWKSDLLYIYTIKVTPVPKYRKVVINEPSLYMNKLWKSFCAHQWPCNQLMQLNIKHFRATSLWTSCQKKRVHFQFCWSQLLKKDSTWLVSSTKYIYIVLLSIFTLREEN